MNEFFLVASDLDLLDSISGYFSIENEVPLDILEEKLRCKLFFKIFASLYYYMLWTTCLNRAVFIMPGHDNDNNDRAMQ